MATVYVPPPSADDVMTMMAKWVARLYAVKVTVRIEDATGDRTSITDGRTFVAARYSNAGNGQIADPAGTAGLGA
jgi:hypothetical protein